MKYRYNWMLLVFVWCCNSLAAQDTLKISELADSFLRQAKLPGLSIAVSKDGNVVYAKGFGRSNLEHNRPMLPSTRIRTASVAKVLTATALGRLATEGLLDFDEPIKSYVPYINKKYADLTIRQLAGHTSGLKHRPSGNGYQRKQYHSIKETLDLIDEPLLFEPGTDYAYSTAAFNLLAAAIEGASGLSYSEYMKRKIFEPLRMHHTTPEDISKLAKDDAEIYFFKNGKLKRDKLNNGSYKIPGAAFRSTPSDLVRLMDAYSEKGHIAHEVVTDMFASNHLKNGKQTNVGVAWRTSFDVFGNMVMEHAGSWRGARTVLVYYPEEKLSISLMINAECQILIEETAHIFAQFFLDKEGRAPELRMDRKIEVVHHTKNGPKRYDGNLVLGEGRGRMTVQCDNYLKSNQVIPLSKGFALSTFYGLFYLEMVPKGEFDGQVYAYYTRNERNPKEEKPLIEFKAMN